MVVRSGHRWWGTGGSGGDLLDGGWKLSWSLVFRNRVRFERFGPCAYGHCQLTDKLTNFIRHWKKDSSVVRLCGENVCRSFDTASILCRCLRRRICRQKSTFWGSHFFLCLYRRPGNQSAVTGYPYVLRETWSCLVRFEQCDVSTSSSVIFWSRLAMASVRASRNRTSMTGTPAPYSYNNSCDAALKSLTIPSHPPTARVCEAGSGVNRRHVMLSFGAQFSFTKPAAAILAAGFRPLPVLLRCYRGRVLVADTASAQLLRTVRRDPSRPQTPASQRRATSHLPLIAPFPQVMRSPQLLHLFRLRRRSVLDNNLTTALVAPANTHDVL